MSPAAGPLLHVGALPFPSRQGTQALLRMMLEAEARAGWGSHLLTYAQAGYPYQPPFALHRCVDFPQVRSLRSGPSVGKLCLDGQLVWQVRRWVRRLRPRALVAHHVEAAAAALCAGGAPVLFVAHTDLGAELPCYGKPRAAPLLGRVGRWVDRQLLRRAARSAAVSPLLAQRLGVDYLPAPVSIPEQGRSSRAAARLRLQLPAGAWVLLYAGNLDGYQGVEVLLPVLAQARALGIPAHLLLATESPHDAFLQAAVRAGLADFVRFAGLAGGESARAEAHGAADLALIPRRAPGGVPIKLLDALARGLAVVAGPSACAGLPLTGVCGVARDGSAAALSSQVRQLALEPGLRARFEVAGPAYIARAHGDEQYLSSLQSFLGGSVPARVGARSGCA